MDNAFNDGLAPDPRSDQKKALDYQHSDIAGDIMINWEVKVPSQWKKYTPREQDGSLSCCGQASAKAVEILNSTIMSAHPIYRSRSNYPAGGMYAADIGEIWKKVGSTTEALDVSQFENETQINREITVVTPTKTNGYIFVNPKDIDKIAEAIELYKHCILIVHCNKTEYAKPIPEYNGLPVDFGHCICAVDYFYHSGKKVILVEDSTGHNSSLDGNGQRLFTADFLSKRADTGLYLVATIPYIFTKTLKFGMNNADVSELQKKLKSLGYFPSTQTITTYFGNITLKATKAFQSASQLVPDGVVGPKTNVVLNSI
jgi:hypothetical protein